MKSQIRHPESLRMVAETELFINRNLNIPGIGWPTLREFRSQHDNHIPHKPIVPCSEASEIAVVGSLVLDVTISLDMSRDEFVKELASGEEKVRRNWRMTRFVAGGFVVHAARCARLMGHQVVPISIIPAPTPQPIEDFLNEIDANRRYLRALPGVAPASIHIECTDGHWLICRPGIQSKAELELPPDFVNRFRIVLINPGSAHGRANMLEQICKSGAPTGRRATVGICARGDWEAEDMDAVRDSGHFVFFNAAEAVSAARRLSGNLQLSSVEESGKLLKKRIGDGHIVITQGSQGALMLNGQPDPIYVPTQEICGRSVGAGDTLLAATSICAACGANEVDALTRGVAAATAHVSRAPIESLSHQPNSEIEHGNRKGFRRSLPKVLD